MLKKVKSRYSITVAKPQQETQTVWAWWPTDGWASLKDIPSGLPTDKFLLEIGTKIQRPLKLVEDLVVRTGEDQHVIEVTGPKPDQLTGLLVTGVGSAEQAKQLAYSVGYDSLFFNYGSTIKPFK